MVHSCWEAHRRDQAQGARCLSAEQGLSSLTADLVARGYNGRFYKPMGTRVDSPLNSEVTCRVIGYVADNEALRNNATLLQSRAARGTASDHFVTLLVADSDDRLWPFLVPSDVGRRVGDYRLVTVEGKWFRHPGRWLLFATIVKETVPEKGPAESLVTFGVVDLPLTCSYCGKPIDGAEEWRFDPERRAECRLCRNARRRTVRENF
jgi:hypothetical protein